MEPPEEGLLLADGFLGTARRFDWHLPVACYDYDRCIQILMEDGCTHEEASEHFEFNVIGAWVGEQTPVFLMAHHLYR